MYYRSKLIHVFFSLYFVSSSSQASLLLERPHDPIAKPESPALADYMINMEQILTPNFGKINCFIRDHRGFLWFGTTRGLCKYDGYQVRVLPVGSGPMGKALVKDQQVVIAIIAMDHGSLLLGTDNGLWRFDLKTEQSIPFLTGFDFSEGRVNAIVKDSANTLWIGTSSMGLISYNLATHEMNRYSMSNGLSENRITSLLLDHSGMLWIGTIEGGVNVLDRLTSRIVYYRKPDSGTESLLSNRINSLCDNDGREIWIGTDKGMNVLDLQTQRIRRLDLPSSIRHTIAAIARAPSGRIWIGASDLGLLAYSNEAFWQLPASSGIAQSLNAIMAMYPDPVASTAAGTLLWVGTRSGVIKVSIQKRFFTNHVRSEILQLDRGAVIALYEDSKGILWVGLWGGGLEALQYSKTEARYERVAHFGVSRTGALNLPHGDVGSLCEDSNGDLWIGTPEGLAIIDNQRKRVATYRHVESDSTSLVNDRISTIYKDRSGTIWICTDGGLSRLIREDGHARSGGIEVGSKKSGHLRFKNYLNSPADAHPVGGNHVTDILEDRLSNLWVATYGGGLIKIDLDGRETRFVHPEDSIGTEENWIYKIVEGNDGLFWLSTEVGLVSFDSHSGKFRRYAIEQLHDAHIFGIVVGQEDALWLSTGIGLVKFNPRTNAFVRYDEKHGMPFKELFSEFFRSTSGRLFVGGLDGFTEFTPENVRTATASPVVALTGFSIFGDATPAAVFAAPQINLAHDQNFFSFSFAVLSYGDPRRNRYSYRMEGVDADWINGENRNYASYTNLDPGEYLFRVKGSNNDDVWDDSGASVRISISPPYWQTWWFRILVVAVLAFVLYALYRYRLSKFLEMERLRFRIADDLHDDVGSNLSAIAMASRDVQRGQGLDEKTRQKLGGIYDTAIVTAEGMKDIVWFIKPENDTLDDLLLRMKDTASALLGEIHHDFHSPQDGMQTKITIVFKRNFFLAFKETLANIVKHASATKVEVHVEQKDGTLEMLVQDDGRGFDMKTIRMGNGLDSLRKRAQSIGGFCEITSGQEAGTAVRFSGKL